MTATAAVLQEEKEGSTFAVTVQDIKALENHPNADRLELATILGWQCVVQKGALKVGDKVVYFPIDSILPQDIEEKIFGPDSKVKLTKSRVKTIKLRGAISQGLAVPLTVFGLKASIPVGEDLTEAFKVKKYEPPAKDLPAHMGVKKEKALENPNFHKYGGIENFKNYPDVFKDEELVEITEKIHGTHFRCGYVKTVANTLWKKILKFFGKLPEYEFVYGSNNVQLQHRWLNSTYYDTNVYAKITMQYNLKDILKPGEVLHGEIYGSGIQKGYTYGCKEGEHKLVVFDIKKDGEYLGTRDFQEFVQSRNLPSVPVLYNGPFSKTHAKSLTVGNSVLEPTQKTREGVVIKPILNEKCLMGRKMLKLISDEYLLGDNTDFH